MQAGANCPSSDDAYDFDLVDLALAVVRGCDTGDVDPRRIEAALANPEMLGLLRELLELQENDAMDPIGVDVADSVRGSDMFGLLEDEDFHVAAAIESERVRHRREESVRRDLDRRIDRPRILQPRPGGRLRRPAARRLPGASRPRRSRTRRFARAGPSDDGPSDPDDLDTSRPGAA